MKLLWKGLTLSIIVTLLWVAYQLIPGARDRFKADETIMASAIVPIIGIGYVIFVSLVASTVWNEWKGILMAIETKNEQDFVRLKDQRLSPHIKLLIKVLSVLLLLPIFFFFSYKSLAVGTYTIFSITLILAAYWEIISDLDDYFSGVWNIDINKLPKEWREKYFAKQ